MLIDLVRKNRSYRGYDHSRKISREELLKMVEAALQEGGSFDLCITDMNYPLQGKKESNPKAGMIFIQRLQEMGVDTPVVLCSSIRYETERAFACIWYSEARNLSSDLREVVARL